MDETLWLLDRWRVEVPLRQMRRKEKPKIPLHNLQGKRMGWKII
jgi:hypothetical protein